MSANQLIYPPDYPIQIVGPSELELRVAELEERLRLAGLQIGQGRREGGQEAIDVRSQSGSTDYVHNVLSRFSGDGLVRGTKALISGGQTDDEISSSILKLSYDTESLTSIGAVLGVPRHSMGSADNSYAGFVAGGTTAAGTSAAIDKLDFTVEATSSLNATLGSARSELVGIGTPSESYYLGGIDTSSAFVSTIEALNHPQNNIRSVGATIGLARSNSVALGNTANGFICAGKTGLGETYTTVIDKFNFGSEISSPSSATLGVATSFAASVGNWLNGYICGGKNTGANTSTIYRFVYGTEATTPISIALTTARADAIGGSSSVKGYLLGGGSNRVGEFKASAPSTVVERLTMISERVSTESIQLLSISLGSSSLGGSASSDYSASVAEQGVTTIANLYDDIYYRKELTLPRTQIREKLDNDLILYVDVANISPRVSGLGTISNPFPSIQGALDYAKGFDFNSFNLDVRIVDGTYIESVNVDGSEWVGLKSERIAEGVFITGNIADPDLVIVQVTPITTGSEGFNIKGNIRVKISGLKLVSSRVINPSVYEVNAIAGYQKATVIYDKLVFGAGWQYHVVADRSNIFQRGSVEVIGSATVHVMARAGGIWQCDNPSSIDFAPSLTFWSVFYATLGGGIVAYYQSLSFTGSNVSGYSAVQENDGWIETLRGVSKDDPQAFAGWPGTGFIDSHNLMRLAGTQTITGVKNFTTSPSVPNGTAAQHAVNKAQLDAIAGLLATSNGNTLTFATGLKIEWGMVSLNSVNWGAGGAVSGSVNYPTPFAYEPVVIVSLDISYPIMIGVQYKTATKFDWIGDSPIQGVTGGTLNWIAIGY